MVGDSRLNSEDGVLREQLQALWREELCPAANGLILASGEYLALVTEIRNVHLWKYSFRWSRPTWQDIRPILADERFTDLDALCSVAVDDGRVVAGETSYGSEGFVAYQSSDRELRWVLIFSNSNPFVRVTCDGETISAMSSYEFVLQVPLHHPETAFAADEGVCDVIP